MKQESPELRELRLDVRRFLAEKIAEGRFEPSIDTWLTKGTRSSPRNSRSRVGSA